MAQVLIRNLDERVVKRLKKRARLGERSLQAELQRILERAAGTDVVETRALASRIRQRLSGRRHSDSAALVSGHRRR